MSVTQAFETTATVSSPHSLQLDEALPVGAARVRVIVVLPNETENGAAEIGEAQWLGAMSANPAFDFLREPAEDIYSWEDGQPCHEK